MGIKRCPNCGNTKLLARKITGVQVESLENGEFQIKAEGAKYQLEIIGCARCKEEFDESKLVEMVQCKKCGKFTSPENLDANGECDVCHALEERPDLANMSKEDLIRMMLKLEKNTSILSTASNAQQVTVNENDSSISTTAEEKMKVAQAAINNTSDEFSKEIVKDTEKELEETEKSVKNFQNAMNPPEDSNTTEQEEKPKRKRGPRKKSEVQEQSTTTQEVEQSVNEISESQEAPFPEQDNEMKQIFDEAVAQEQQNSQNEQNQSPFQMFEDEQSF